MSLGYVLWLFLGQEQWPTGVHITWLATNSLAHNSLWNSVILLYLSQASCLPLLPVSPTPPTKGWCFCYYVNPRNIAHMCTGTPAYCTSIYCRFICTDCLLYIVFILFYFILFYFITYTATFLHCIDVSIWISPKGDQ